MKIFWLLFLLPCLANAYVPPAFFLLQKVAESRQVAPPAFVVAKAYIYRDGQVAASPLWERIISLSGQPTWPLLSLSFDNNALAVQTAATRFSVPVTTEIELQKVKAEKLAALTDVPNPFYKRDPHTSLRRWKKNSAWVISGEKNRSIWIDKDLYRPLVVLADCPGEIGGSDCSFEFLSQGNTKTILVKKQDKALVQFRFEKTDAQKVTDFLGDSSQYRDAFQTLFLE